MRSFVLCSGWLASIQIRVVREWETCSERATEVEGAREGNGKEKINLVLWAPLTFSSFTSNARRKIIMSRNNRGNEKRERDWLEIGIFILTFSLLSMPKIRIHQRFIQPCSRVFPKEMLEFILIRNEGEDADIGAREQLWIFKGCRRGLSTSFYPKTWTAQ